MGLTHQAEHSLGQLGQSLRQWTLNLTCFQEKEAQCRQTCLNKKSAKHASIRSYWLSSLHLHHLQHKVSESWRKIGEHGVLIHPDFWVLCIQHQCKESIMTNMKVMSFCLKSQNMLSRNVRTSLQKHMIWLNMNLCVVQWGNASTQSELWWESIGWLVQHTVLVAL